MDSKQGFHHLLALAEDDFVPREQVVIVLLCLVCLLSELRAGAFVALRGRSDVILTHSLHIQALAALTAFLLNLRLKKLRVTFTWTPWADLVVNFWQFSRSLRYTKSRH